MGPNSCPRTVGGQLFGPCSRVGFRTPKQDPLEVPNAVFELMLVHVHAVVEGNQKAKQFLDTSNMLVRNSLGWQRTAGKQDVADDLPILDLHMLLDCFV